MKKLISTIAFVLGLVALSFAQDATNTASAQGADALVKSKSSGTYVYVLPEGTTQAEVEKSATYYVDYFTVDYANDSREATITLVGEAQSSTRVMMRFLSGCGAAYVNVDGETKRLDEFYNAHLK